MRKNSIKNTRVNAEVQRELSTILRGGIKDPRVAPMTERRRLYPPRTCSYTEYA